jgi:hypothetical protein
MAKSGKPFKVDTRPTKLVVVDGLTRDASVQACIFDLVDNSIDAAQEEIFQGLPLSERDEIPESYEGYEIDLTINGSELRIVDNCGGIPVENPKSNRAFWKRKFAENVRRDRKNYRALNALGWKVVVLWQCEVRTKFAAAQLLRAHFKKR